MVSWQLHGDKVRAEIVWLPLQKRPKMLQILLLVHKLWEKMDVLCNFMICQNLEISEKSQKLGEICRIIPHLQIITSLSSSNFFILWHLASRLKKVLLSRAKNVFYFCFHCGWSWKFWNFWVIKFRVFCTQIQYPITVLS